MSQNVYNPKLVETVEDLKNLPSGELVGTGGSGYIVDEDGAYYVHNPSLTSFDGNETHQSTNASGGFERFNTLKNKENTFAAAQNMTTLRTKSGPWVDVTHPDHGVVGDGSTDDAPALSNAIQHAANNDLPVLIPAGEYRIGSKIDASYQNLTIFTAGENTVIKPDAGMNLWLEIKGTSTTPIERLYMEGMHVERQDGGSIRLNEVQSFYVGNITGTGTGGGLLSVRNLRQGHFEGAQGWDLGNVAATMFCVSMEHVSIGYVSAVGYVDADKPGQALDFSRARECQVGMVYGKNVNSEPADIGNAIHCHFGTIVSLNSGGGLDLKIEDPGSGIESTIGNKIDALICIDHAGNGLVWGTGPGNPTGTQEFKGNTIGKAYIESTETGSIGIKGGAAAANPRPDGNTIQHAWVKVDDLAIDLSEHQNLSIESGWYESINGDRVIYLDDCLDCIIERAVKVKGQSNGNAALTLSSSNGMRCFAEIVDTADEAITYTPSLDTVRGEFSPLIRESQKYGVKVLLPSDAGWSGTCQLNIRDGRYKNVDKANVGTYAIHVQERHGGVVTGVVIDNNHIEDDQGTPTTNGIRWLAGTGSFDQCADRNNFFGPGVQTVRDGYENHGGDTVYIPGVNDEPVGTMTDGDTTPSVAFRDVWKTNNSSPTTITDFDDGYEGKRIFVRIADANTTINFNNNGSLLGNGSADWSPSNLDFMTCVKIGTAWHCDVSDNTA